MSRKLASIQKIEKLEPIPNADQIEVATVLGWKVVINKKDKLKVGDPVVFFEVDSILPECQVFEFMRERKFRVKTIRLRGQISQGLVMPYRIMHWFPKDYFGEKVYALGDDVTDVIGVKKYEPEIFGNVNLGGQIKGNFPGFLQKTDEIRIQSNPGLIDELRENKYYITEKLDGTSATFYLKDGEFGVCSRNVDLKETDDNLHWQMALKYKIEEVLRDFLLHFDREICVQGEIIGPQVNGNRLRQKENQFYIFDIHDISGWVRWSVADIELFCSYYDIPMVPHVETQQHFRYSLEELIQMANGNSALNPDVLREGIVVRPQVPTYSEILRGNLSFKVISNEYLLKHKI